jgi:phospholipid transport system substrate-binding protein
VVVLAIALVPTRTCAAPAAADPTDTVRQVVDSLRKLRTTTDSAARANKVASIDAALAIEPLCRQALGAQWSKLSSAEQKHFVSVILSLLHKIAYPKAAEFFSGLTIEYHGERPHADGRIVDTAVKRREGGEVSIDYVLEKTRGGWKIRDILLDRQSLAASVAGQIQGVLKQGSYADLVRQMEARLKQNGS